MLPVSSGEEYTVLRSIAQWLQERTGIYYPDNKLETLKHKLFKVCLDHRLTLSQLSIELQNANGKTGPLCLQVVAAASTNHTAFFREDIWDWFRDDILSDVVMKNGQIRLWSAAASSGEEAYTAAMVSAETLGIHEFKKRFAILGTDISFQILRQAEDGIYPVERLSNIPDNYRNRYFVNHEDGSCTRIHEDLKSVCLFRRMNLKKRPYPFKRRFHIIFCRNVLYYFTPSERENIVNAIYDSAEPGGWLIVSVTESLNNMKTPWKRIAGKTGIYRKE